MNNTKTPIKLFISYSHVDEAYFNVISNGIKQVVTNSQLFDWNVWDDTKIHVGTFWDDEIQNNIENCNVALLLCSIGFMSSNYIREKEFNEFKRKHEKKGILIFPIVFKPCDFNAWEDLGKLQFFKPNGSKYGKADVENFTYADLIKFAETNGVLIPNTNLDRYHLDLFNKIEDSFGEFNKINYALSIDKKLDIEKGILNKLSDYPKPSVLFTGRNKELSDINTAFDTFNVFAIEGLGGTGKTQVVSKFIEDNISDKKNIIWLNGSSQSNFDIFVESSGYGDVLKGEKKSSLALYSGFKDLIEQDERIIFWDNFNDYDDPSFKNFLSFAYQYLIKSKIILITKTDPLINGITTLQSIKIEGLQSDAIQYAKKLQISNQKYSSISEDDLIKMCDVVEGHPLAIEFSLLLIGYGKSVDEIINHMPEFSTIRRVEEFSKRLFLDILNHPKTPEEERKCFLKCSVFKEKFTFEEVKFLYDGIDVFEPLSGLIDKLLITFKNGFYEIHPLVRSFSYEILTDKIDIHKKAALFFLSKRDENLDSILEEKIFYHLTNSNELEILADFIEINGSKFIQQGQLSILNDILDKFNNSNISRQVFKLLKGDILEIKGKWDEAFIYFEEASDTKNEPLIRAQGIIKCGEILYRKGKRNESKILFEKALEFSINNSLRKQEARSLNDLGLIYHDFNDMKLSLKMHNEALNIKVSELDSEEIAISNNNIGNVYISNKQFVKAKGFYNESIKIAKNINDENNLALYLTNLASVYIELNELPEALDSLNLSIKTYQKIGNKAGIAHSLNIFGNYYNRLGQFENGFDKYNEALKIHEEIGSKYGISGSINNIGVYHFRKKNYEIGLEYIINAYIISKETGDIHSVIDNVNWIKSISIELSKEDYKNLIDLTIRKLSIENQKHINYDDFFNVPIINDKKKYNRNDKIKVKYNDEIKEGKFKNFENDLNSGKCILID